MSDTFLSKEESTSLKGVLILLVVLGHNSIITDCTGIFPYLYSFHVFSFYIFPYVYGMTSGKTEKNTVHFLLLRQWHNIRKLGIIYLCWCFNGIFAGMVFKHTAFQPLQCIHAILWGHQTLLADYCGFSFLWFLPTLLAVMFWRDVYFVLPAVGKLILFLCAVLCWVLAVAGIGNSYSFGLWCPFALIQGLFFSASGIAVRFLLQYIEKCPFSKHWFVLLFPVAPAYVWFRQYLPYGYNFLTWSVCPVFAFLGLYAVKDILAQVRIFQIAGKYSLQIYLLHTVIFNTLLRIMKSNNLLVGILIYCLTLLFCGVITFCVDKSRYFRWILFPITHQSRCI